MPFKSASQRRYLFAKEPEVAKEFASHMTHKDEMKLPEHVQKMSGGGYMCGHCGGMVDEEGLAEQGEGLEEEAGETEQHEGGERLSEFARKIMGRK
jgi:hypothetical protein